MILSEKNTIITGARGSIGKATLELFAKNGANIWACYRTKDADFEAYTQSLAKDNGVWITPIYFDLSDEFSVKDGIQRIIKEKQPIDVLVNNAGIADSGTLNTTTLERIEKVFKINYFAQVQIMQYISRAMIRQKSGGAIVNVASIGGIEANPGYFSYGSSKAALIWATRAASKELGKFKIHVNAVAPGMINAGMGGFSKTDTQLQKIIEETGLKRLGTPKEVAEVILFLASEKASFINGEIVQIDGGR